MVQRRPESQPVSLCQCIPNEQHLNAALQPSPNHVSIYSSSELNLGSPTTALHSLPTAKQVWVFGAQLRREGYEWWKLKKRDKGIINLDTLSNTVFCHSRRWQLHLLPSWRKSERQSGSSGEPCGLFPELGPLYDLLVSHVWFPCGHTKGQAALPETRRVWPAGLEGHWTPRRPLAGRACPAPQVSETLPGKFPSVGRAAASGTWG